MRCAEGVGDAGLREFVNPDGADWVSRRITDVIFQAPDDTEVVLANSGAAGEWRLCADGHCRTLSEIFGAPIGANVTIMNACEP